jgi:hypothetical protein
MGQILGEQVMSKSVRVAVKRSALALFGFGALSVASGAWACGEVLQPHPASWQDEQGGTGGLLHQSALTLGARSIVGMWSFQMVPTAGPSDFGYQQWHSDGTELMNSGGRAPATENFCMGVWTQTAPLHYHLDHYALSYDSSGTINAKVTIKEDVTLAPNGTTYSGPFTLNVYDPNTNALMGQQTGQVTAQRVPAN